MSMEVFAVHFALANGFPVPSPQAGQSWCLEFPGWCDFSFKVVNSCFQKNKPALRLIAPLPLILKLGSKVYQISLRAGVHLRFN